MTAAKKVSNQSVDFPNPLCCYILTFLVHKCGLRNENAQRKQLIKKLDNFKLDREIDSIFSTEYNA